MYDVNLVIIIFTYYCYSSMESNLKFRIKRIDINLPNPKDWTYHLLYCAQSSLQVTYNTPMKHETLNPRPKS